MSDTQLKVAYKTFCQDALAELRRDPSRQVYSWDRPWVRILRDGDRMKGRLSFPQELRRVFALSPAGETAVGAIGSGSEALEVLLAQPNADLLAPGRDLKEHQSSASTGSSQLGRTFVVGFIGRYLAMAPSLDFNAPLFDELFEALEDLLTDGRVANRFDIPLHRTRWNAKTARLELSADVELVELTDDDREKFLNAEPWHPMQPNRVDAMSLLWSTEALLRVGFRHPLHGGPDADVILLLGNCVSALRLAAPGGFAATRAVTGAGRWAFGRLHHPLAFAGECGPDFSISEEAASRARDILDSLRALPIPTRQSLQLPLDRFHRSFGYARAADRVVDLVTVIDALVGDRGPGAVYKASMRLSVLVAVRKKDRTRTRALITEAYKVRSAIVHGATTPRLRGDYKGVAISAFVSQLEDLVRLALVRVLSGLVEMQFDVRDLPEVADGLLLADGVP